MAMAPDWRRWPSRPRGSTPTWCTARSSTCSPILRTGSRWSGTSALIQSARESAGVFGLLYIDLNEFKQVNDLYGHLAGDLYLQEVATRMKRQLRPCDMLARLGGDEFAVLVSEVHNRTEIEEISARLQSCFHEPFIGDGYVLQGSASFGLSLYPEDADTADSLLRGADAAMYVAKYTRLANSRAVEEEQPEDELAPKVHS